MSSNSNLITTRALLRRLDGADVRVLDCRFDLGDPCAGRRAYEAGHIPGAIFADLDADLSAPIGPDTGRHPLPEVADFAATLGHLGIDDTTDVIVYDDGPGSLAARAWWMLRWLGHTRVRLLDGGLCAWETQGLPIATGIERSESRLFAPHVRDNRVVSTTELVASMRSGATVRLIDARDAARFRGEVEPIDKVAGHIPGARNLPIQQSLDDAGFWRPEEELEALWSSVLGDDKDTAWIAMCGSGVTACHLAISALQAGFPEPRLYAGSWSEWIRDPTRPVARGGGQTGPFKAADLP